MAWCPAVVVAVPVVYCMFFVWWSGTAACVGYYRSILMMRTWWAELLSMEILPSLIFLLVVYWFTVRLARLSAGAQGLYIWCKSVDLLVHRGCTVVEDAAICWSAGAQGRYIWCSEPLPLSFWCMLLIVLPVLNCCQAIMLLISFMMLLLATYWV